MEFSGKSVIVTGAATGIGRACVIQFLKQGAFVSAIDLNSQKLEQLKQDLS